MQLRHDAAETGTFRDSHGFVAILSSDGMELVRDADFQHNRSYHEREQKIPKLVAEVVSKLSSKEPSGGDASPAEVPIPTLTKIDSAEAPAVAEAECVVSARAKVAEVKSKVTSGSGSTAAAAL